MRDFTQIIIAAIGVLSFIFSVIYFLGAIRTKDKNAGYISIALMIVCVLSIFYLTF